MAYADLQSRLEDMRLAIDEAMRFTAGMIYEGYLADPLVRRGTERCIEIVSEASRHIPHERKAEHPQVPWRNVADIGNVLRHGYRLVDLRGHLVRRPRAPAGAIERMLRDIGASEPE